MLVKIMLFGLLKKQLLRTMCEHNRAEKAVFKPAQKSLIFLSKASFEKEV